MCAKKIDGISYPDSWSELVKDKTLLKVFAAYGKKKFILENILFLTQKRNPNRDYIMFVHDNAKDQVNISGTLKTKMDDLFNNSPRDNNGTPIVDWQAAAWTTHLKAVETELRTLLNQDHLYAGSDFWKSEIFKKHHAKLTGKASPPKNTVKKIEKLPWKELQFLGWENPKHQLLQKYLVNMVNAYNANDIRAAKNNQRGALDLQSDKGLVKKQTYEATIKAFKSKKLIPK